MGHELQPLGQSDQIGLLLGSLRNAARCLMRRRVHRTLFLLSESVGISLLPVLSFAAEFGSGNQWAGAAVPRNAHWR